MLTCRNRLACFGVDESKILILDMGSPGSPVAELVGHQGPLSAIAWGSGGSGGSISTGGGWLASCGELSPLLAISLLCALRRANLRPTSSRADVRSGRRAIAHVRPCPALTRVPTAKHSPVERENVQVRMDRGENVSTLEIEVEIPNSAGMLLATGT